MWSVIGVVLLALLSIRAQADPVTELPGLSRETLSLTVASTDVASNTLEALVIRPDGPGPLPLALISHGMPRSDIPETRPQSYSGPAIAFAQHGYAAVIVMRRGYGHSTGTFAETLGPCDDRNYISPGKAAAADVLGALEKLQQEPWVDPKRVLLVGHSNGRSSRGGGISGEPGRRPRNAVVRRRLLAVMRRHSPPMRTVITGSRLAIEQRPRQNKQH